MTDAVEVAAGERVTCARRASGVVSCWGYDYYGGCGSGLGANQRNEPVPVADLP
ncbi:MAG: RCC1 domain-containing protein [Sandaracinaceae bacterium]|nr:RCC1 domain-containing protein [Sandaracinaceae bacterium]